MTDSGLEPAACVALVNETKAYGGGNRHDDQQGKLEFFVGEKHREKPGSCAGRADDDVEDRQGEDGQQNTPATENMVFMGKQACIQ